MLQAIPKTDILKMELLVETVRQLSLARDIKAVMHIVRSVARQITGADGATFVLRDNGFCYYADEDAISPLWKGSRFPMKACISGWVMLNREPAVIKDIYADERIPADAYRPTFVKSLAMVPIRTSNPLGAIGNYWARHYLPTDAEVAQLQALADITAVSIENIEVRGKIKEKLSERTQMCKQLRKQKEQLEEFTHIIAHNMRAPLSNLLLLSDLVDKTPAMNDKLEFLEKQKPIIDFLHETFEELVNATQVKKDFSVKKTYVDFEKFLNKSMNVLQGDIISSNARITSDFSKAKTVYFPAVYMESLLFNLLSNALKYRSAERAPVIHFKSYKKAGTTYLDASDNGLGIDLKKHGSNLFKLRKTFHPQANAKGFGLFITKTQIEAMGGQISAISTPGHGSTFTVKF